MFIVFLLVAMIAGVAGQCVDQNPNCPTWAKNGFCTNSFYLSMVAPCLKSCNRCPNANCTAAEGMGFCASGVCPTGFSCNLSTNVCCRTTSTAIAWSPTVNSMCPPGYVTINGGNGICYKF